MSHKILIGNKYIGRNRPILFLTSETSNSHLWEAAWLLFGDHELGFSKQEAFRFTAPKTLDLNEFMALDGFEKHMIEAAESHFHHFLSTNQQKFYQIASGLIQNFEFISSTDPIRLVISIVFGVRDEQIPMLEAYADVCYSQEIADAIRLGLRFKRQIKIS